MLPPSGPLSKNDETLHPDESASYRILAWVLWAGSLLLLAGIVARSSFVPDGSRTTIALLGFGAGFLAALGLWSRRTSIDKARLRHRE
jgi:hypothetical protein